MDFQIFTFIGAAVVVYSLLKFAWKIIHFSRVYMFPSYPDFAKYGKWSVVTGSTDGIGKAIACQVVDIDALQLAAKGQNIVLIARNEEKLKNVAREIGTKNRVKTKCLKIDFSADDFIYDDIKKFLEGYDIGVLVNNVGTGTMPMDFLDALKAMPGILQTIMRVNVTSMVKMTELVLPGMVDRRRGLIINVASQIAIRPALSIYGSTKAFMNYFSQALSYEYEDKGIIIQSCLPGFVKTNMTKGISDKQNPFKSSAVTSDHYAHSLLATVEKQRVTYGCWKHEVQAWLTMLPPTFLYVRMMKKNIANLLKSIKKDT